MLLPLYDINPHRRLPIVTVAIIVANIAAMVWETNLSSDKFQETIAHRGFIPARIAQLSQPKKVVQVAFEQPPQMHPVLQGVALQQRPKVINLPADRSEILLSLFTMMFLHGGWMHLASNMWFLWIFGNNIEDRLGHAVFVAFYLLGGLIAALFHWLAGPDSMVPVIGASGAVAAILGAYAITFPKAKVKSVIFLVIFVSLIDLPALIVLGFWFFLQMASALGWFQMGLDQNVAFWAHIGGFVAGIVLMPLLALGAQPADSDWFEEAKSLFDWDEPSR